MPRGASSGIDIASARSTAHGSRNNTSYTRPMKAADVRTIVEAHRLAFRADRVNM